MSNLYLFKLISNDMLIGPIKDVEDFEEIPMKSDS